ncbi:DoxX family protein [Aliihoeflea sp. PC F10.4]
MSNDVVLLIARIALALMFLISGVPILLAPSGFAGYMGSIGMPAPMVVAILVALLKIVAGLALVVGFQVRPAAYALAAFCVVTAFIGHFTPDQMQIFWKNIAVAGGLLALSVSGPGALSLGRR